MENKAQYEKESSSKKIEKVYDELEQLKQEEPLRRLEKAMPNYKFEKHVGQGTYGQVYKAYRRQDGAPVAVKLVKNVFRSEIIARQTLREIRILRELTAVPGSEKHVTQLLDVVTEKEDDGKVNLYMVMNYISTNLDKFLKVNQRKFSEKHVIQLVFGLLQSLKFIHSANIMHRDIKPANLLVTESLDVVLCDFGLARSVPASPSSDVLSQCSKKRSQEQVARHLRHDKQERRKRERRLSQHVQSRWYRAPEVILLEKEYSEKVDVWSVGCIVGELLSMSKEYSSLKVPYGQRQLFAGSSCFPLSPHSNGPAMQDDDQFKTVLGVIGQLSNFDKVFLTEEEQVEHVSQHEAKIPRVCFKQEFSFSRSEIGELIQEMLEFNPYFRSSASDLLENSLFDKCRKKQQPFQMCLPKKPISLLLDEPGVFSYNGHIKSERYAMKDFRKMMEEEEQYIRRLMNGKDQL